MVLARFNFPIDLDKVEGSMEPMFTELCKSLQRSLAEISAMHNARIEALVREVQQLRLAAAQTHQLSEAPPPPLDGAQSCARLGQVDGDEDEGPFQHERTIRHHQGPVHSIAALAGGSEIVATASWDATVKIYDLAQDSIVRTLGGNDDAPEQNMGGIYAVAFAKTDSSILGCASADHGVYIWNHETGTLLRTMEGHVNEVNDIDFHASQNIVATASDDQRAIAWDYQEGIMLRKMEKHPKEVYGVAFLGQENQYLMATCCNDQQTRIWDMRDRSVVTMLHSHSDDVIGVDYNSEKQLLATGSDDGTIALYESRMWKLFRTFATRNSASACGAENEVKRVRFAPGGDLIAGACSSGNIVIYGTQGPSTSPLAMLRGHGDCVFDVAWSLRGSRRQIISASHDRTSRYWLEAA